MPIEWFLAVTASYLIGTFPTAIVVGRTRGVDPTRSGSGNPGATNVYRTAGKKAGAVVLVGDLLKGMLTAAGGLLLEGRPLAFACWAAAVIGHIFPVFRRFRGGKGVATGAGGVVVLLWYVAVCCLVVFVVVLKITRRPSVASLVLAVLVPILTAAFGRPGWEVAVCAGLSFLVIARHWSNLTRLFTGRETPVSAATRSSDARS